MHDSFSETRNLIKIIAHKTFLSKGAKAFTALICFLGLATDLAKASAPENFHRIYDVSFTSKDLSLEEAGKDTAVVVGAGPAGLASAIALKKSGNFQSIVVLEKRQSYSREQLVNISKHALLSMIELEPRILIHLLELGRSFLFEEHVLIDKEHDEPIIADMRPFKQNIEAILGQNLTKYLRSASKLIEPIKSLEAIDHKRLTSEKQNAQLVPEKVEEVVLASPINDLEYALNFVAVNYYGITIVNQEADWQTLSRGHRGFGLLVNASGSGTKYTLQPDNDIVQNASSSTRPFTFLARVYSAVDNCCNLFPDMFPHGNRAYDWKQDIGAGSVHGNTLRINSWESVYHSIVMNKDQELMPNCTVTIRVGKAEFYTFVVAPVQGLVFELRPTNESFFNSLGLEFASFAESYSSEAYILAANELEKYLGSQLQQQGKPMVFREQCVLKQDSCKERDNIVVGDALFQGLAFMGLGAGFSFSIYSNILSKKFDDAEKPKEEIQTQVTAVQKEAEKVFKFVNIEAPELTFLPSTKRHDLFALANEPSEVHEILGFLKKLEKHYPQFTCRLYFEGEGLNLEELPDWVSEDLSKLLITNQELAEELKRVVKIKLGVYAAEEKKRYQKELSTGIPSQFDPSQGLSLETSKPNIIHFQQFHYSYELELAAKIIRGYSQTLDDYTLYYMANFLEGIFKNTPLSSRFVRRKKEVKKKWFYQLDELNNYFYPPIKLDFDDPQAESLLCACKKYKKAAWTHRRRLHQEHFTDQSYLKRNLILKDYLQEAALDLLALFELGPRFDLIVESQRNILIGLFNLYEQTESLAIIDESLMEDLDYNPWFHKFMIDSRDPIIPDPTVNPSYGKLYELDEDQQNTLRQASYSPLHQRDPRFREASFALMRQAFKEWKPGHETVEQSNMLFRYGAGPIFYALKRAEIFPGNGIEQNKNAAKEEPDSSGNERNDTTKFFAMNSSPDNSKYLKAIFKDREIDTAKRVKKLADLGYKNIVILYGESHKFKPYFSSYYYNFTQAPTVHSKDHIKFFKLQDPSKPGYSEAYLDRYIGGEGFRFSLDDWEFRHNELPDLDSYWASYKQRARARAAKVKQFGNLRKLTDPDMCHYRQLRFEVARDKGIDDDKNGKLSFVNLDD